MSFSFSGPLIGRTFESRLRLPGEELLLKPEKKYAEFFNTGIFSNVRHYVSLAQLKQLYNSVVHPYICYANDIHTYNTRYDSNWKFSSVA